MIREFTIENFKSIESFTLPLGRVTVLIGENGAGKSNILEAMAFFVAALQHKADHEVLFSRGVRDCKNSAVISAFGTRPKNSFRIAARSGRKNDICNLKFEPSREDPSSEWNISDGHIITTPENKDWLLQFNMEEFSQLEKAAKIISYGKQNDAANNVDNDFVKSLIPKIVESGRRFKRMLAKGLRANDSPFVIFSPENTALRTFESEGQMRPLGVRGEGLFKLVQHFAEHQPSKFNLLRRELKLFDWFEDFAIPKRLGIGESRLDIKDRFLAAKRLLDQRSANEGFLFLLFYLCLFLSPQTPKFFAIDNIDASLNPKLCAEMMRRLVALAKQEDKQVVITTHNPAILDGLDLKDKEQMLYAIQRNEKGRTIAQRIPAPKPQPGEPALKLSHAYLRGLLGGVPKNF